VVLKSHGLSNDEAIAREKKRSDEYVTEEGNPKTSKKAPGK